MKTKVFSGENLQEFEKGKMLFMIEYLNSQI